MFFLPVPKHTTVISDLPTASEMAVLLISLALYYLYIRLQRVTVLETSARPWDGVFVTLPVYDAA